MAGFRGAGHLRRGRRGKDHDASVGGVGAVDVRGVEQAGSCRRNQGPAQGGHGPQAEHRTWGADEREVGRIKRVRGGFLALVHAVSEFKKVQKIVERTSAALDLDSAWWAAGGGGRRCEVRFCWSSAQEDTGAERKGLVCRVVPGADWE